MNQIDWKRLSAGLAAASFGVLGALHLLTGFGGRAPWGFGLGFVSGALIFGFWGSEPSPVGRPVREQLEATPALDGIDVVLAELIDEAQDMSEREKKAAERLAIYNGA